jgi:HK97 gp10 family phage protein
MADLVVTGMEAMTASLNAIAPRLAKNALAAGLRQAANIIKDEAKANLVPVSPEDQLSGALKASIRTVQRRGTPDRVVFNVVAGTLTTAQVKKFGPDSPYYALWVEKGHINRKMHDALFGTRRFKAYQRQVSESNTPAHPYMAPAAADKGQQALDTLVETVRNNFAGIVG